MDNYIFKLTLPLYLPFSFGISGTTNISKKYFFFSNKEDIKISLLGALCSNVKWAAKSSVTWLGSPPGKAAQTGHTYQNKSNSFFGISQKIMNTGG